MLRELVEALISAKTARELEFAYRQLERVGVDRRTANVMAAEVRKEKA